MLAQLLPGIVIGVVVALVGAFATHLLIRRREEERWKREMKTQRERWEREDKLQRQQWDREDRMRLYADRVALYRDFLAEAQRLRDSDEPTLGSLQELVEQINLISSNEVYVAATAVLPALLNYQEVDKRDDPNPQTLGAKFQKLNDSLYEFRNTAREYVGGVPESPA